MKTTLKFKVELFDVQVHVIFTDNTNIKEGSILKNLYKKHNEAHKEDREFYGACFSPDDDIYTYYIIYNTNFLTHRLIAHEAEHLKNYIFERFNYTIKSGDEEIPPSLCESIIGKIYDFINKKKIKVFNAI